MKFFIKEARERIGLTQRELAASLGIKATTFNGYETGQHDPKSEILIKIAQKCNVSVDYLLGVSDNPHPIEDYFRDSRLKTIIRAYDNMNEEGRERLITYASDISGIPALQKENQLEVDTKDA